MAKTSLGLDLSLAGTGAVVVTDKKVRKTVRIVTTPRQGTNEKRINNIWKKIYKLIEKYQPDIVVIEGYAYAPTGQRTQLAELGGVVKHYLAKMINPPFIIAQPNTIKKLATGNGRASKEQVLMMARQHYEFKTHDEADAFWLAKWGLVQLKEGK